MKKFIIASVVAIIAIAFAAKPNTDKHCYYVRNAWVEIEGNTAVFNIHGEAYEWTLEKGDNNHGNGDVTVCMHDNGTPDNIYDDAILDWWYQFD